MTQCGFDVKVRFEASSPFAGKETTLHNITEIHYRYHDLSQGTHIAFESDIDATGYTYEVAHIAEFEAVAQAEKVSA